MSAAVEAYLILSAAYPLVTGTWLLTGVRRRVEREVFEGSQGIRSLKHKYRLDSPIWVLDKTETLLVNRESPCLVNFECVPALPPQKALETVNFVTKTVEWRWDWPNPRFWAHQKTGVFSLEGRERVVRAALWRSRPIGFVTVPAVALGVWLLSRISGNSR